MRPFVPALLLVAYILRAQAALAQSKPSDDAERAAARSLGYEGVRDYERGSFSAAVDKLDRAYALVHMHSLGVWSARAMVARGMLVQAAERYLDVARLPVQGGDSAIQTQAREDAATERAALLVRIPLLRVALVGAPSAETIVTLDGDRVHPALVGTEFGVNPGTHTIEARRRDEGGGVRASRTIAIEEGQRLAITLDVSAASRPSMSGVARARSIRLTAAVALAAGALASVIVGGVAGGLAAERWSAAQGACPGLVHCASNEGRDLSQDARAWAQVSTVAFGAGASLFAGSAILWASAPSVPRASIGVGPAGVAARGWF